MQRDWKKIEFPKEYGFGNNKIERQAKKLMVR
jgi:hypothetical protein